MDKAGYGRRRMRLAIVVAVLSIYGHKCACSAKAGPSQSGASEKTVQMHRVIVKYHVDNTAGGLINQMLCHIGAFLLAIPLKAEIWLPGALSRSTFDTKWWQQEWQYQPLQSLLDVQELIRYWQKRGIVIHQDAINLSMDRVSPDLQGGRISGVLEPPPTAIVKFGFEGQGLQLAEIVVEARARIHRHKKDNPALDLTIIDLGVINSEHFPYNLTGCEQMVRQVVKGLVFAPSIKLLAREVIGRISSSGSGEYNGLHLRFETDALSAWAWEPSAKQVLWDGYADGMKRATFNADTDLYIASGLEASSTEFLQLSTKLQKSGMCRAVLHKEKFLSKQILAGLHSEQKALIDLLVLVHSDKYVGTLRSSFSCYTRDLRNMQRKPSNSSIIVKVGDFPLSILPFQELIPSRV